ncbi:MAG: SPOR domain-containing protein [Sulfuricellaceae bacterium]|nr:SPOR domain-containing protein [Sulfuricellaceae bacterium]
MANSISPTVEELQLRKRARRRLIGAITLVALMVAILPMVLDNDPKPIGPDVEIDIPSSKNAEPFTTPKNVETPKLAEPPVLSVAPTEKAADTKPVAAVPKTEAAPPKVETTIKSVVVGKEPAAKITEKQDEEIRPPAKSADPPISKPATDKPVERKQASGGYIVLLGAFLGESNASQRQARLKELGVKFYIEKIQSPAGEKIAVRAGPYASREEAERMLAKLKSAGIQDGMVAEKK